MPALVKKNVIFDSKTSSGWFFVPERAEADAARLELRVLQREYLKIWSSETYKFM